jgi:hypothetical protein
MFDTVETLMSKAMIDRASGKLVPLTPEKLSRVPFLLGILAKLKDLDQKQSRLIEHLAKSVVSMNQSLRDYDDAIEALNFYYKQRYVRGVSDHLIESQLLEIEHEKAQFEVAALTTDDKDRDSSSSGTSGGKNEDGDSQSSSKSSQSSKSEEESGDRAQGDGTDEIKGGPVASKSKGSSHKKAKRHSKNAAKDKKSTRPIFRAGQTLEEALEAAKDSSSFKKAAKMEVLHPIKMCDKLILKNYGIEGFSVAEEVDPAVPLSPCERIENSCCDQAAIQRAFEIYQNNQLEVLKRTYEVAEQILESLLSNYRKYNKVAYYFLNNQATSHTCKELARKTVFMPVSKDFTRRFMDDFRKAHEFSKRAKANYICWVCNYDFQKHILARTEITLVKEFCSSMMESHYSLLLTYYMQLVDYLNDVADLLQCDQNSGLLTPEYAPRLAASPEMTDLLLKCSENKKYCLDFCTKFSFTSLKGPLEPNVDELKSFYYWMEAKMEQLGDPLEDDIDIGMGGFYSNSYKIQKSKSFDKRSISNLAMKFKNPQKGSLVLNPEADGEFILAVISQDDELTEF